MAEIYIPELESINNYRDSSIMILFFVRSCMDRFSYNYSFLYSFAKKSLFITKN